MKAQSMIDWARRLFAAWILIISAVTAFQFVGVPSAYGAPGWLLVSIAGIETIAAAGFIWRASGLAMAGLVSAYSAAAVIHVVVGKPPYMLLAYAFLTISLYLGAKPRHLPAADEQNGE